MDNDNSVIINYIEQGVGDEALAFVHGMSGAGTETFLPGLNIFKEIVASA